MIDRSHDSARPVKSTVIRWSIRRLYPLPSDHLGGKPYDFLLQSDGILMYFVFFSPICCKAINLLADGQSKATLLHFLGQFTIENIAFTVKAGQTMKMIQNPKSLKYTLWSK